MVGVLGAVGWLWLATPALAANQVLNGDFEGQCHLTWVDLHGLGPGNPPNYIVNVADLQMIMLGLRDNRWTDVGGNLKPGECP